MPVDPQKAAQLRELTKSIKARMEVNLAAGTFAVQFTTESQDMNVHALIPNLTKLLAEQLGSGLSQFYGIAGEWVEL